MDAYEIIRRTMKEFSDIKDEDVQFYISLAEPMISERKFGKLYPQALAYLAAHRMKMAGLGEESIGEGISASKMVGIASVSEGDTSVSFFNNQQSSVTTADAEYSMTMYGQEFLSIRKKVIVPIVCSGEASRYGRR